MLPALLARIGLPMLIRAVSEGLGRIENPAAQTAVSALKDAHTAMQAGTIAPEAVAEANRHIERLAEAASDDPYVRRMRPTFGYAMALSWCAQMGALAWVIVTEPERADAVIEAMTSLGTIWTMGLSVLGIYVYKRSEEKKGGG
ncbi:3TM-type holin [Azospirillum sp. sgz301742]